MSYELLKKFVRCDGCGKELNKTVDVEEAKKWLKASECVMVSVTDGTYSKYRKVSKIYKKENVTVVKIVSGEVFYIKGIDSNERVIELDDYSLDHYGIELISENEAKEIVNEGFLPVYAIGHSNGCLVATSSIKRFINDKSFETVSGSIYRIK